MGFCVVGMYWFELNWFLICDGFKLFGVCGCDSDGGGC